MNQSRRKTYNNLRTQQVIVVAEVQIWDHVRSYAFFSISTISSVQYRVVQACKRGTSSVKECWKRGQSQLVVMQKIDPQLQEPVIWENAMKVIDGKLEIGRRYVIGTDFLVCPKGL